MWIRLIKIKHGAVIKGRFSQEWAKENGTYSNHLCRCLIPHYNDVIMSAMASQITGVSSVYSTICSDEDQRKHQSSASLAFVRGIHRSPFNSPHEEPVTRKCFHLMTSSCVAGSILSESPCSAIKPSKDSSNKHNERNMVCFDKQPPKLIHYNNSLKIPSSGGIPSWFFEDANS